MQDYNLVFYYTVSQSRSKALINTKIAALKEVARKYPRSLITSKVVPINPKIGSNSEKQYSKKQGYNPTLITDEHGNTWNEVDLNLTPNTVILETKIEKFNKQVNLEPNGSISNYKDASRRNLVNLAEEVGLRLVTSDPRDSSSWAYFTNFSNKKLTQKDLEVHFKNLNNFNSLIDTTASPIFDLETSSGS